LNQIFYRYNIRTFTTFM